MNQILGCLHARRNKSTNLIWAATFVFLEPSAKRVLTQDDPGVSGGDEHHVVEARGEQPALLKRSEPERTAETLPEHRPLVRPFRSRAVHPVYDVHVDWCCLSSGKGIKCTLRKEFVS